VTDPYPTVDPDDAWRETDRSRSVLADPGPTRVRGHTLLFEPVEDVAVEGVDRFAFASALSFDVPLPPGLAPTVRPMVVSAAEGAFADRLRERGLANVDRHRRERFRTDAGRRGRLRRVTAEYDRDGDSPPVPVEGWLATWAVDGQFRVAGGAYLTGDPLGDGSISPGRYREELLAFVRGVE
jgi:hypothetical protein